MNILSREMPESHTSDKGVKSSMKPTYRIKSVIVLAVLASIFAGCGGGGGGEGSLASSPPPGAQAPSLAWDPPQAFSDNSALDPYRDLAYYELYLRSDTNFTDSDLAVAQVAAITNVTSPDGQTTIPKLTEMFDLNNLAPFTQNGSVYYLSIKSVGVDGLKSVFSAPVVWNNT